MNRPLAGAVLLAVLGVSALTSALLPNVDGTLTYLETFPGVPAGPEPVGCNTGDLPGWDIQCHHRNGEAWGDSLPAGVQMEADHSPTCGNPMQPDGHHPIDEQREQVYRCNDHVMTAINGEAGYGAIVLTPGAMVDLRGDAIVRFDMSTFRNSTRDWVSLTLSAWDDNLNVPLADFNPDLQGEPRNGIEISMSEWQSSYTPFIVTVWQDGHPTAIPNVWWDGYEARLTPDKARRDTFELVIENGRLKFWMPDYGFVFAEGGLPALNFDEAVVQIGHHSYTPAKGACMHNCPAPAGPSTWHFDNVEITPAIPFSIIHADKRTVPGNADLVTFDAPAPANSWLRFSAVGGCSVSFGGPNQPCEYNYGNTNANALKDAGNSATVFMPIPEGVQSVTISLTGREGDRAKIARDFAIWSLSTEGGAPSPTPSPLPATATATPTVPSSPTATATATPTMTPTTLPTSTATTFPSSTATPTVEPTSTSTPTATQSPPTASPTRTPTRTPTPVKRACTLRFGNTTIRNFGMLTEPECRAKVAP